MSIAYVLMSIGIPTIIIVTDGFLFKTDRHPNDVVTVTGVPSVGIIDGSYLLKRQNNAINVVGISTDNIGRK